MDIQKKQIFRIGIKNYPAAHGGVETCTYNFVKATKDKYDFTIFTVWGNPTVKNNEIDGVKVYQLAKGWLNRFRQIRSAVTDKKNTILDFQMEIFIPLAVVFSILGYNVVSSIHGRSWRNVKIGFPIRAIISIVDILGVNLTKKTIYVSREDFEAMKKYTFRRDFHCIPNGSPTCDNINEHPEKDMVFIGRISIQKNIDALIAAAEKYNRKIDIYGPFDDREVEYTTRIKKLFEKSRNATYCGVLKPEEIYETLGRYRFAVNASKSEASPCSVIEAGACGLRLYLSDIPGHRQIGYPDVFYFDKNEIALPTMECEPLRSHKNVRHHRNELSESKQIAKYAELYESFK